MVIIVVMKNYIYLFIPLFLIVSMITLYGFFYKEIAIVIYGVSSLFFLLMILFILNSYSIKNKYEIDENVLHLTQEIIHELNIPISTIQSNVSLIRRQAKDDNKMLKRLSRIEDASKRLERLYEELYYSIKKEIKTVEREKVEVSRLVKERVSIMKQLNRNPFELLLERCFIVVDKIGFEKMLDNILTNAMKYSSKESLITVRLEKNILSIEDRGVGMDEVELLMIYERYFQLNNKIQGKGIGLALVQTYCNHEKIKIEIDSQKEVGTWVKLDLKMVIV